MKHCDHCDAPLIRGNTESRERWAMRKFCNRQCALDNEGPRAAPVPKAVLKLELNPILKPVAVATKPVRIILQDAPDIRRCFDCDGQTRVSDSRSTKNGLRRRRVCLSCGAKFTTLETLDWKE